MKKALLASALIVGFTGLAQAETSVTLYGVLDTGYGYQNTKYAKGGVTAERRGSGLRDGLFNGNRWGLKGSEDLGNGLSAIFTLEQGFTISDGAASSTRQFHRQSWVGLSSDSWGVFTMGRQYNIAEHVVYSNDISVGMGDMDKTFGAQGSKRMDNSFKYMTPSFSGFKAGIAYGNPNTTIERYSSTAGDKDRANWLSTGVGYSSGLLALGASYDRASSTGDASLSSWAISGSYDFEVAKLALVYGQDRRGKIGWSSLNPFGADLPGVGNVNDYRNFKSSNYHVALSAPVGGGTLAATWSRSSSNLDDAAAWGDAAANQNIYHINYKYPLSKRTSLYSYASYGTGLGYVDDLKGTEAGVGINHRF
jgi:predicted porin